MSTPLTRKLKVFYCYSRRDHDLRDELERHLSDLKRFYHLETWFDRQINPGENWEKAIEEQLNKADLILLLISPDFLASDYCYNIEMQRALTRHARGEAKVIPILLRPVHWRSNPFQNIQMLPKDALPLTRWSNIDDAFYNIVLGIESVIEELLSIRKTLSEWIAEGIALNKLRRYDEAIQALEQAIRLDPNSIIAYNSKGHAFHQLGKYDEAIEAFERAIHLDPANTFIYYNKGVVLSELRRYDEAIEAFERAIYLDPNIAIAYCNKGYAFHQLGKYDEAIEAFERAIHLDPNAATAHYNKGVVLNELKRYDEAIEALDQAIHLGANSAIVYDSKGHALNELKRYNEAIQALDQAIRLDPGDALAYNNKGVALNKLKRYDEAKSLYQKAKELGYT